MSTETTPTKTVRVDDILAALTEALGIDKDTLVQIGNGKVMPFSKAVRFCRSGLAIRYPGNSRNLVERDPAGVWYY